MVTSFLDPTILGVRRPARGLLHRQGCNGAVPDLGSLSCGDASFLLWPSDSRDVAAPWHHRRRESPTAAPWRLRPSATTPPARFPMFLNKPVSVATFRLAAIRPPNWTTASPAARPLRAETKEPVAVRFFGATTGAWRWVSRLRARAPTNNYVLARQHLVQSASPPFETAAL